uniref:Helicase-associated domain-containing protein n=1 Tax=Chaetoceros debilis TaxID=122233 RepID=A0A7S3PZ08_9STRA
MSEQSSQADEAASQEDDQRLCWNENKSSRIGSDYQVTCLPLAGSYSSGQDNAPDNPEAINIWDPARAEEEDVTDFVDLYISPSKKWLAIELLHERQYSVSTGFMCTLDSMSPMDGSDWTLQEHEKFRHLMRITKYDMIEVAKQMKKSVANCLTVYYKIINVRETRSSRMRLSQKTQVEERGEFIHIGRGERLSKRNAAKTTNDTTSDAEEKSDGGDLDVGKGVEVKRRDKNSLKRGGKRKSDSSIPTKSSVSAASGKNTVKNKSSRSRSAQAQQLPAQAEKPTEIKAEKLSDRELRKLNRDSLNGDSPSPQRSRRRIVAANVYVPHSKMPRSEIDTKRAQKRSISGKSLKKAPAKKSQMTKIKIDSARTLKSARRQIPAASKSSILPMHGRVTRRSMAARPEGSPLSPKRNTRDSSKLDVDRDSSMTGLLIATSQIKKVKKELKKTTDSVAASNSIEKSSNVKKRTTRTSIASRTSNDSISVTMAKLSPALRKAPLVKIALDSTGNDDTPKPNANEPARRRTRSSGAKSFENDQISLPTTTPQKLLHSFPPDNSNNKNEKPSCSSTTQDEVKKKSTHIKSEGVSKASETNQRINAGNRGTTCDNSTTVFSSEKRTDKSSGKGTSPDNSTIPVADSIVSVVKDPTLRAENKTSAGSRKGTLPDDSTIPLPGPDLAEVKDSKSRARDETDTGTIIVKKRSTRTNNSTPVSELSSMKNLSSSVEKKRYASIGNGQSTRNNAATSFPESGLSTAKDPTSSVVKDVDTSIGKERSTRNNAATSFPESDLSTEKDPTSSVVKEVDSSGGKRRSIRNNVMTSTPSADPVAMIDLKSSFEKKVNTGSIEKRRSTRNYFITSASGSDLFAAIDPESRIDNSGSKKRRTRNSSNSISPTFALTRVIVRLDTRVVTGARKGGTSESTNNSPGRVNRSPAISKKRRSSWDVNHSKISVVVKEEGDYDVTEIAGRRSKRIASVTTTTAPAKRRRVRSSSVPPRTRNIVGRFQPDSIFEERLEMLLEYKKEYGHCYVPKTYPPNQLLASWIYRQRGWYRAKERGQQNSLTDERQKILEDHGFVFWVKNSERQLEIEAERRLPERNAKWRKQFLKLKAYQKKHGNCLVPKIYQEDQPFSSWVFSQRHHKKLFDQNKPNQMTKENMKELEELGFVWDAKSCGDWRYKDRVRKQALVEVNWQRHYDALLDFVKIHGHTRVPKVYRKNQSMSSWVFRQRAAHKKMLDGDPLILSKSRLEKLTRIGFEFSVRGKISHSVALARPTRSFKQKGASRKNVDRVEEDDKKTLALQDSEGHSQSKKDSCTTKIPLYASMTMPPLSAPEDSSASINADTSMKTPTESLPAPDNSKKSTNDDASMKMLAPEDSKKSTNNDASMKMPAISPLAPENSKKSMKDNASVKIPAESLPASEDSKKSTNDNASMKMPAKFPLVPENGKRSIKDDVPMKMPDVSLLVPAPDNRKKSTNEDNLPHQKDSKKPTEVNASKMPAVSLPVSEDSKKRTNADGSVKISAVALPALEDSSKSANDNTPMKMPAESLPAPEDSKKPTIADASIDIPDVSLLIPAPEDSKKPMEVNVSMEMPDESPPAPDNSKRSTNDNASMKMPAESLPAPDDNNTSTKINVSMKMPTESPPASDDSKKATNSDTSMKMPAVSLTAPDDTNASTEGRDSNIERSELSNAIEMPMDIDLSFAEAPDVFSPSTQHFSEKESDDEMLKIIGGPAQNTSNDESEQDISLMGAMNMRMLDSFEEKYNYKSNDIF